MAMLFPDAPADLPEGFAYHADIITEVEERALLGGLKALAFGEVRMRGQVARRRTRAVTLAPRSAYVLDGAARWQWQHAIPPGREERYSVTFRTLRDGGGPA